MYFTIFFDIINSPQTRFFSYDYMNISVFFCKTNFLSKFEPINPVVPVISIGSDKFLYNLL